MADLKSKIESNAAVVGVLGLGYVGLPLALEFARKGLRVRGFDVDAARVRALRSGRSYIGDVASSLLKEQAAAGRFRAEHGFDAVSGCDALILCVPTPLRKTKEPDVSYILSAASEVARRLAKGRLVVLESTTYPGTTRELVLPLFEKRGMKAGKDFFLAFSPERVDPSNPRYRIENTPKVVGGITPACGRLAAALYSKVVGRVVSVSGAETAEMVKLLENTFRAVNIGLVNEIALMCDKLGLDVWEVIEAAKTKPFGFMPFYPGPGIGGHCIPSDPMYLAWKARAHGFEARFIELADQVNRYMPHYVVDKIARALNTRKKALNGSRILLIGLAYKKDVNDTRDSPAFDVAQDLCDHGARVAYHDPYVATAPLNGVTTRSTPLTPGQLARCDAVVILTDHANVDYGLILRRASLIVDTRNHYRGQAGRLARVVRL